MLSPIQDSPNPTAKTGLLVVNLGTPDAPTRPAVYRYLKQFLLDPRVIDINPIARNLLVRGIIAPFRSGQSAKGYAKLWTAEGSPLKFHGENLVLGLRQMLGEGFAVELAMRYQSPSIESAIEKLLAEKVDKIIVFPLFPQYASASTGSVQEEIMRIFLKKQVIPALDFISSYPTHAPMIRIFAENARQFDLKSYDHVLFSFHGLPQRQLRKADQFGHCLQAKNCCENLTPTNQYCYSAQCFATAKAIANELEIKAEQYTICFQSRLGSDPWTEPFTPKIIESLAQKGAKRLLVFSPAFTADCLETVVEIGQEYREDFEKMGGEHLDLVPSLNSSPGWVRAVGEMIQNRNL